MSRLSLLHCLEALAPARTFEEALEAAAEDAALAAWVRREAERLVRMGEIEGLGPDPGAVVAGTDEVGRGPLAGPLVAAAVAFRRLPWLPGLRDSKKMGPEEREGLVPLIQEQAESWAVEVIPVAVLNGPEGTIHSHSLEAMRRCVVRLDPPAGRLLVDGRFVLKGLSLPQQAVVGGDDRCLAVAAASVLAKVHRDRLMEDLDRSHPGYGFARNKGYGTPEHLEALERLGPCPAHRTNFGRVRALVAGSPEQGVLDFAEPAP